MYFPQTFNKVTHAWIIRFPPHCSCTWCGWRLENYDNIILFGCPRCLHHLPAIDIKLGKWRWMAWAEIFNYFVSFPKVITRRVTKLFSLLLSPFPFPEIFIWLFLFFYSVPALRWMGISSGSGGHRLSLNQQRNWHILKKLSSNLANWSVSVKVSQRWGIEIQDFTFLSVQLSTALMFKPGRDEQSSLSKNCWGILWTLPLIAQWNTWGPPQLNRIFTTGPLLGALGGNPWLFSTYWEIWKIFGDSDLLA